MANFLNSAGLSHVWSKILGLVGTHNVDEDAHAVIFSALNNRITELESTVADLAYEYQGVEYLESQARPNNTQYINTNVYPTGNTRVLLDMQLLANESGYRIMGEQKTTGKKFRFGTFSGTGYLIRYAGVADYNVSYGDYSPLDRHTFEIGRYFKIDGNQLKDFGAQTFTGDIPIYLFAINDASLVDNAHMKLFSCKIYEGEELIRDFVPCYHRIFEYKGLYDKAEGKLYQNLGRGEFSVGPSTEEKW